MSSDAQTGLTVAAAGERQVVERLQHIFERPPNERRAGPRVGNGDDAAVREAPAGDHVSCVDMISAGNDWFDGWTPRAAIGHRALAVSLSDIAAMGARATGALVAWRLPSTLPVSDVEAAARGLAELAVSCRVDVLGGDVDIGDGPELISVTALGSQVAGSAWRRDAARPGQRLWLVGEVGLAGWGLAQARRSVARGDRHPPALTGQAARALDAHLRPTPLLDAASRLQGAGVVHAAIDISDGLWLDALRLAEASGVSLQLTLATPGWWPGCAHIVGDDVAARVRLLGSGDDYALLVTAAAGVELQAIVGGSATARCLGDVVPAPAGGRPTVALSLDGAAVAGLQGGFLHGR